MLVGDPHGEHRTLVPKLYKASDHGIQHVLIAGDFGLWDHDMSGTIFLDEINEAARINRLSIYAIPGNHENWDHWSWYVRNLPKSKGFALVRSRVLLAPRIHEWTWDHKKFISAGGAVSVDRDWRLSVENGTAMGPNGRIKATGPRTLWWPEEQLTDQNVIEIQKWGLKADYLITHDCSNYTPFGKRLKDDPESERHRRRIDEVLRATKPELHFHGHMHEKYDWENSITYGYEHYTKTYGLECNADWYSWGILDTATDRFVWRDNLD